MNNSINIIQEKIDILQKEVEDIKHQQTKGDAVYE